MCVHAAPAGRPNNCDNAPTRRTSPKGGDIENCLTATEIDKALEGLTVLPAATFWRLAQGEVTAGSIRATLLAAGSTPAKLFVVWIRHHWVLARIDKMSSKADEYGPTHPQWFIYDSARSAPVERDLHALARTLSLAPPTIVQCPQQRRGSLECGLFVILNALLLSRGQEPPRRGHNVSLAALRSSYPQIELMLAQGRQAYDMAEPSGGTARRNTPLARFLPSAYRGDAAVIVEAQQRDADAAAINLCFALVGSALASIVACQNMRLDLPATCAFAVQAGLRDVGATQTSRNEQCDVEDFLAHFAPPAGAYGVPTPGSKPCMQTACEPHPLSARFLVRFPGDDAPPPLLRWFAKDAHAHQSHDGSLTAIDSQLATFVAGAVFHGEREANGARHGHYSISRAYNVPKPGHIEMAIYEVCPPKDVKRTLPAQLAWARGPLGEHFVVQADATLPRLETCNVCGLSCFLPNEAARMTMRAEHRNSKHHQQKSRPRVVTFADTPLADPAPPVTKTHNPYAPVLTPSPQTVHTPDVQPLQEPATEPRPQTTLAPPATIPQDAAAWSHSRVRTFLRSVKIGSWIRVRWQLKDEAGLWLGVITGAGAYGLDALVDFRYSICENCEALVGISDFMITVPFASTQYLDISQTAAPNADAVLCCCERDEEDEDEEERTVESTPVDIAKLIQEEAKGVDYEDAFDAERADDVHPGYIRHAGSPPPATPARGYATRSWFIFKARPPHVASIVWRQMADATRKSHIRWLELLKALPDDLRHATLGRAVVSMVLRVAQKRKWKSWATFATAYATIATALRQLPIYTTTIEGIDIRHDPAFSAAYRRAVKLSKVTRRHIELKPLAFVAYKKVLATLSAPRPRLLLQLLWALASRGADTRQLHASDIEVLTRPNDARITVTFRFGKGAHFWGPYSICALVSRELGAALRKATQVTTKGPLFTLQDQRSVSNALKTAVPEVAYGIRSVRSGALQHLAEQGVDDNALMLLSGHRQRSTLQQSYLGWGKMSASARAAAEERGISGAGAALGEHAGFCGRFISSKNTGRRRVPPPPFIPLKAPSAHDLGIAQDNEDAGDPAQWPLHVKKVSTICWKNVLLMAEKTPLADRIRTAHRQATTDELLCSEFTQSVVDESEVPLSSFSPEQVRVMIDGNKLRPFEGKIRGFAKGWLLPQAAKMVQRPIFEPQANSTCNKTIIPHLQYPPRRMRRAAMRGMLYAREFDFSAYFDQVEIPESIQDHFIIRIKGEVDGCSTFALTRLPMGARWSPSIAQALTWLLVLPLIDMDGIRVDTMLDNVRIAGKSLKQFDRAIKLFLARCAEAHVQINPAEPRRDDEPLTFLGEHYGVGRGSDGKHLGFTTVANSDKNVGKLRKAVAKLQAYCDGTQSSAGERQPYTIRNLASLIGLCIFMWHTIDVSARDHSSLLRTYSKILGEAARDNSWDEAVPYVAPSLLRDLHEATAPLLANIPVSLPELKEPSYQNEHYDFVVVIDASKSGWGAHVQHVPTGVTFTLQQRWNPRWKWTGSSASAEPAATACALRWLREHRNEFGGAMQEYSLPLSTQHRRIAVVSDHDALVRGQRRWDSGNGGFSTSYHLNSAYKEMYNSWETEAFSVAGALNMSDDISRCFLHTHYNVVCRKWLGVFPALSQFAHPFSDGSAVPKRNVYMV